MLEFMDRDVYYKQYKSADDDAGAVGIRCPEFVAPSHGNGYIVSPSPDKNYNIQFKYYMNNVGLNGHSDQTRIPNTYDNVIIDGALYYMYRFSNKALKTCRVFSLTNMSAFTTHGSLKILN
jgi:hypothetical protein